jgi:small conductance mechanosensitive channel
MMLAINNPFRIGDYVDIGSTSGSIQAMDMMSVTLTTPDNKKITMANKLVWGSVITNYSYTTMRRVDMVVPVAYGSDYEKVKKLVMDLLMSYPETLPNPLPTVEVSALADSRVNIIARPWVVPENYWSVYWRFQQDILVTLKKNGIEVPFNKLDINILSTPKA